MSGIVAIVHILGAIVANSVLGFGILVLGSWEAKRNQKAAVEEVSVALGIPADSLERAEHASKLLQFAAARFSPELLRNRLSDLCGWISTAWGWLSILLQVGVLLTVIWFSITDGPQNAIYAWWAVAIIFIFWIPQVLFSFLCKLATGRFPGQARQARKQLAKYLRNQRESSPDENA
jgi:hypothetical protein